MTTRPHPIPRQAVTTTLKVSEDCTSDVGNILNTELLLYHEILTDIQDVFEENLRSLVGGAYSGTRQTGIEVFWESPAYYILADDAGILREALTTTLDLEPQIDPVVGMHSRAASRLVADYPELEPEAEYSWIVAKPSSWYSAQWALDRMFTHLLERGLSPTQALDYWMVNILGKRSTQWAERRGTTGAAIRETLRTAEENLEVSSDSLTDVNYAPFERIYTGHRSENTCILVDGHFLYPRRDIFTYASSGKLTWGYRGAGPYQLAVALLADVLETDDLPFEEIDEFVGFLNSELGDQDDWTLSKDTIRAWVYAQTDYFD